MRLIPVLRLNYLLFFCYICYVHKNVIMVIYAVVSYIKSLDINRWFVDILILLHVYGNKYCFYFAAKVRA